METTRRPNAVLRPLAEALLDIVYPPLCAVCGSRAPTPHLPVCPTCLRRPERIDPTGLLDAMRTVTPRGPAWLNVFALWAFDKGGAVQALHHALKYGNRPSVGRQLGLGLGRAYVERFGQGTALLVLPIPLSRVRLLERGYNQSALLAEGFGRALSCEVDCASLVRIRGTRSQVGLSVEARRSNVRGAFALSAPGQVANRHVALVDDVLTTGATLTAASEVVAQANPASISVVTLSAAGRI